MFVLNLDKTAIINLDSCVSVSVKESKVVALLEKHHPDCPHAITLADYSDECFAKEAFTMLMVQLRDANAKVYSLPSERQMHTLYSIKEAEYGNVHRNK